MRLPDLRGRATITVPEYGALVGRGRSAAYEDARQGRIPVVHLGGRVLIPVAGLLGVLGFDRDTINDLLLDDRNQIDETELGTPPETTAVDDSAARIQRLGV